MKELVEAALRVVALQGRLSDILSVSGIATKRLRLAGQQKWASCAHWGQGFVCTSVESEV